MSDLISRQDAIYILACEMYAEAQSEGYEVNSIEDYIPEATAWMNDAPTAEAVEVVRCMDCKYRDPEDGRCDHGAVNFLFRRTDNDYCSFGERR